MHFEDFPILTWKERLAWHVGMTLAVAGMLYVIFVPLLTLIKYIL